MKDYRSITFLKHFIKLKVSTPKIEAKVSNEYIEDFIIRTFERLVLNFGNKKALKKLNIDISEANIRDNIEQNSDAPKPFNRVFTTDLFKLLFDIEDFNYKTVSAFITKEVNRSERDEFFKLFSRKDISAIKGVKSKAKEEPKSKTVKKRQVVQKGYNVVDYKRLINAEIKRILDKNSDKQMLDEFVIKTLPDFYAFTGVDSKHNLNAEALVKEYKEAVKVKKNAIRDIFNEDIEKELKGLINKKIIIEFLMELAKDENEDLKIIQLFEHKEKIGVNFKREKPRYKFFKTVTKLTETYTIRLAVANENINRLTYALKVFENDKDITKDLNLNDNLIVTHYARHDRENDKSVICYDHNLNETLKELIYDISDNHLVDKVNQKTYSHLQRFRNIVAQVNNEITIREKNNKHKVYYREIDITNLIKSDKLDIQNIDSLSFFKDNDLDLIVKEVKSNTYLF